MSKVKKEIKTVEQILTDENPVEIRALFSFSVKDNVNSILDKYNLWVRYFFPKYFYSKEKGKIIEDADFHKDIDLNNLLVYIGELNGGIKSFTDICFRGAAKTTRTKLFVAFCILNDAGHYRRYFKVLTKDLDNAKQIVTDVYNMFVTKRVQLVYQSVFEKSEFKREERMDRFTTSSGVKMVADTVGVDQRGALQEEARPDFEWFDDFETRKTLRSAVETNALWLNMEEARTGLSADGGCIYTCNYVSERGNVHKLVQKKNKRNVVLIVPIIKNGVPTWEEMYDILKISQIKEDAEDYEGEYLCEPSAGGDVIFDRQKLNRMLPSEPVRVIGQFKMFKAYNPSHRYAGAHDVAGGVGLDSSTSVFIDFDTIPCRVVATYKDNTIKPDVFGYEIASQGDRYGECLIAPEQNNHGHATIAILKQNYGNIFATVPKDTKVDEKHKATDYGWKTNAATKPKMLMALRKAVDDGLLELTDEDLINEAKSYSRDDLMDTDTDPRLSTRHFDLLMACAIAWQMKDYATYEPKQTDEEVKAIKSQDELSWEERFDIL